MNQRASHFVLGNTSQSLGSVYAKDFGSKPVQPVQSKHTNPFRGTSLNQAEHGSFVTTNKTLLRAWDNVERARLDDDKLHELKSHHFKLGSYAPEQSLTTNKTYHDRKQISGEASKNQEESKNKMRAHNHDFKEGHTNYRSAYANEFTGREWDGRAVQGNVVGQQAGNAICFGNNVLPMQTTSGASFTPKEGQQVRVKPQATLGVRLGEKGEPMQTINQLYYTQKQPSKATLPESTMKELRGTHFQMGQMAQQFATESGNYRSVPSSGQQSKLTYKIPVYESGTWVDKQARFDGGTTNKQELREREVKAFERAVQVTRSGIDFGGHAGSYVSEAKSKFGAVMGVGNALQINKKSSVVIGGEGKFYESENKKSFKVNDLKEGRIDVDIKKLSQENHFQIGGKIVQPKFSVYKDEHRADVGNRNRAFHKENK